VLKIIFQFHKSIRFFLNFDAYFLSKKGNSSEVSLTERKLVFVKHDGTFFSVVNHCADHDSQECFTTRNEAIRGSKLGIETNLRLLILSENKSRESILYIDISCERIWYGIGGGGGVHLETFQTLVINFLTQRKGTV
jgi:hypothetical protein